MSLSDESIKEFQDIFEKEYGKKLSWEEAADSARNLVGFFKILYDGWVIDEKRKARLKTEPKGFHISGGPYNCFVCHDQISDNQTWYDKYGIKCLLCQKAVEKHIVPGSACRNKDSWYSVWELDYYYKIKSATVRKLIRQGKLKARIVPGENGGNHFELLLIKDNPGTLPNKHTSRLVKTEDGHTHVEYEPVELPEVLKVNKDKNAR